RQQGESVVENSRSRDGSSRTRQRMRREGERWRQDTSVRSDQESEVDVEDSFGEEHRCVEGLILGAGGNLAIDGEIGEEGADLGSAQGRGMTLAMKEDKATRPINIAFLGSPGIVVHGGTGAGRVTVGFLPK